RMSKPGRADTVRECPARPPQPGRDDVRLATAAHRRETTTDAGTRPPGGSRPDHRREWRASFSLPCHDATLAGTARAGRAVGRARATARRPGERAAGPSAEARGSVSRAA